MPDRLVLPPVEAVDALPPEVLPGFVGQLAALQTRAVARLMAASLTPNEPAAPEQCPLTQEEAAERYRMPLRKMRFLTRTGRVPSYQQGRNRMVRTADLDRYLARCRDQGVAVGTLLDVVTLPDVASSP